MCFGYDYGGLFEICMTSAQERVLEMVSDEDAAVRAQVLHTLCDGSPGHLEDRIMEAMEDFNRDSDKKIRRTAHKVRI